ncbi:MAG: hypothetical protein ACJA0U_000588 [Salibacteraceae bacterium]|jgi:hypothetical protein
MKLPLILLSILFATLAYAQADCKPYIPNNKEDKWEVTSYSAKDKATGRTAYELMDKAETDSTSTFTIKATSFDTKDKETYVNTFTATCKNGEFIFDMAMKLDGAVMQAYKDMDVVVEASEFEVPPTDTSFTGALADGTLNIGVSMNGIKMGSMNILIYDREVERIEQITATAGTFNCIKLKQKIRTKAIVKIEGSSTEWYSEGIGMVRSESFNGKGKLTGYSELTMVTN